MCFLYAVEPRCSSVMIGGFNSHSVYFPLSRIITFISFFLLYIRFLHPPHPTPHHPMKQKENFIEMRDTERKKKKRINNKSKKERKADNETQPRINFRSKYISPIPHSYSASRKGVSEMDSRRDALMC